ncbi:hypothetical protein [Chenggangzhangella methanolivorans]|uniref:hypothetical protein n=1 Tax=Chenggangzhangella methanolivorans TaxID=1437009 RepID=UPI0021BD3AE8|nr:hypothetical protein [Chenggangzhangella methanolivorans]
MAELEEQVDDLDRLTPLLQRRVEAGASSSAEISRGRLATETTRVELAKAKASFQAARRELSVLIGEKAPSFTSVGRRPLAHRRAALVRQPDGARCRPRSSRAHGGEGPAPGAARGRAGEGRA